ncbi:MAG: acyl-CoA dehydrogenase family protein [Deltaproteobacteria bacterium]|nr:acyl-CoA dehydrogenase family protein [Deltaproteobacteria bacterium]MBW2361019.1 acyl-CoA dehydrogenase family protein [Deltaproteobacteria bacterium]
MQLAEPSEHRAFRREVSDFVAEGAGGPPAEFWRQAIERGYLYRDIPRRFGGSEQPRDLLKDRILDQELSRVAVGPPPCDARGLMIVHTLLDHGSPAQQERFVAPTLRGELLWCQGYSEPNAGSDLASLRATARLEGDRWILDGQKIWTSGAAEAHAMFGLFRTEPDASKHAGISYLLIDMSAPGIRVAPMRQIDGGLDFNEVFFDSVPVPAENLVGGRGEGWAVSRSTLKYERGTIGGAGPLRDQLQYLVALARRRRWGDRPAIQHPSVRQRLAEIDARVQCADLSGLRTLSAQISGRLAPTLPLMLMAKLYATDTLEQIARLAEDLLGEEFLTSPSESDVTFKGDPETASYWVHKSYWALGVALGGGTSNIQRNIIGEKVLGLPRDPRGPRR